MPEVRWSRTAERAAFQLPAPARRALMATIASLRLYPEIGMLVTHGRYRGTRRIPIRRCWLLYYRVVGSQRTCVLVDVRDARRRPI